MDPTDFSPRVTAISDDGLQYSFDVMYQGVAIASFVSRFINELVQHGRCEGEIVVEDGNGTVLIRMERQFLTEEPTVEQRQESMSAALTIFGQEPEVIAFLSSLAGQ